MSTVFISYRRDDSAYAAKLIFDSLAERFGADGVTFDVDSIPFGVDWRDYLAAEVGRCDALLAIIGDQWLQIQYQNGPKKGMRRLDDPEDFVRFEIDMALARGIPVVPVLVGRAGVPPEADLPAELKGLARRNAAEVRPGRDLPSQLTRLAAFLEQTPRTRTGRRIFLCYAGADHDMMILVKNIMRVLSDRIFDDLSCLRAGERWDPTTLIRDSDIFVLLWSRHLAQSKFAEREWRFALSLKRENFIRPLLLPDAPPPPSELMDLYFVRLDLPIREA